MFETRLPSASRNIVSEMCDCVIRDFKNNVCFQKHIMERILYLNFNVLLMFFTYCFLTLEALFIKEIAPVLNTKDEYRSRTLTLKF